MGETLNSDNTDKRMPSEWESLFLNDDRQLFLNNSGTRKQEYMDSTEGIREANTERDLDKYNDMLERAVRDGLMTKEEAYKKQDEALENAISRIDTIREEALQRQRQETPAEPIPAEPTPVEPTPEPAPVEPAPTPAPILEPTPKPAPTPAPAESAPTPNRDPSLDSNDKKPNDSEIDDEKAKRVEELKRQLEENEKRLAADKKEMDEAMKELEELHLPVVVNMMDEMNATDLAWNLAEQDLQKEIENAGKVGRFLKGKLFRKRYLKRYMDEYIGSYKNGELGYKPVGESGRSIYQVADDYNHASLELAYDLAAKASQGNVNSEGRENIEIAEADGKKNADIIKNVMDYCMARRNLKDDESSYELEKNLREKLSAIVKTEDRWLLSEYIKNADQAYRLLELGIPIEQVTERFRTYNARIIDTRPESERFDINQIFARINYNSGDRAA